MANGNGDAGKGLSALWGFITPVVGWLVAALVAWSLMGTRVAVLEQRSLENERRIEQLESDVRRLDARLAQIQEGVARVENSVTRVEARLRLR